MNTSSSTASTPSAFASTEDKTTAIVSYLTLIGFIVAIVMHGNNKTRLGAYHLRQTLGLIVSSIAIMVGGMVLALIPFLGWLAVLALWIGLAIVWLMGLLSAMKGEQKPVPVLGQHFEKWFATAFQ